ncbi:MAG: hypothetical protein ACYDD2_13180 [Candidatus Acidiferrales bacterium]
MDLNCLFRLKRKADSHCAGLFIFKRMSVLGHAGCPALNLVPAATVRHTPAILTNAAPIMANISPVVTNVPSVVVAIFAVVVNIMPQSPRLLAIDAVLVIRPLELSPVLIDVALIPVAVAAIIANVALVGSHIALVVADIAVAAGDVTRLRNRGGRRWRSGR